MNYDTSCLLHYHKIFYLIFSIFLVVDLRRDASTRIDEIRVNRENDLDTISNKTFDFSSETIKLLLERGYKDALDGFEEYKRSQASKTADSN